MIFNSKTIILKLDKYYYYINNPLLPFREKVINNIQYKILESIRNNIFRESNFGISESELKLIVDDFIKFGFVNQTKSFNRSNEVNLNSNLSFWLHTSDKCNLSCPYCYIDVKPKGTIISKIVLEQITYKTYQTIKTKNIRFCTIRIAGGEPFLSFNIWHEKISQFINKISKLNCTLKVSVISNGTIINSKIINYLKSNNIGLSISLDGLNDFHNQSRKFRNGNGSFKIIDKNLKLLKKEDIKPYILVTIDNGNLKGLENLTKYLIEMNLGFRFSFNRFAQFNSKDVVNILSNCYKLIEKNVTNYSEFKKHRLCEMRFNLPIIDNPCGIGNRNCSINHDGTIYMCQTEHQLHSIGSIFNDDLDIIDIIKNQNIYTELNFNSCNDCNYIYFCSAGCSLIRKKGLSPFCNIFRKLIPLILKIRGEYLLINVMRQYE